jgi:hypothetical protein
MTTSKADAERNLKEFLEAHGREGFLRLLLTNYLFELAMYYLHTGKNPAAQVTEDTGYRFYVGGRERVYKPDEIDRFKQDLRGECEKKAILIVEKLGKMELLEKLDKDFMADPRVAKLVQEAFESMTQKT